MDAFLLQVLNGLDKGSAYALIALGLTLVFGTLGVVNFAFAAVTIPVVIIGLITTKIRIHNIMGMVFCGWQILLGFGNIETLAS